MIIGIDARFFGPLGKGLGRYTQKLVEHLETVADEHEYVVFLRKENFDLFQPKNKRFRKVLADFHWYTLAEQLRFPSLMKKEGVELMHFPHFNIPILTPCPFLVTIHDLILLRYPTRRASTLNWFTYRLKYAAYRFVIQTAVRKSERIITVSEFTKMAIIESFKVKEEKVVVTYEAAEVSSEKGRDIDFVAHGITKPYLLYVGNAYPHKNLERLLQSFANLRKTGVEAQLVLVGKADYFYDRLQAEAGRMNLLDGDVIFYGYAEDAELEALYTKARAYIFPSLLEGFGLPPLEAMQYGTPVLASHSSCLPEILGDAAEYFNPEDLDDIQASMQKILNDEHLREELIKKGRLQAEKYSWDDCARRTYDIYQQVSIH